jgi:hypothetical protein
MKTVDRIVSIVLSILLVAAAAVFSLVRRA